MQEGEPGTTLKKLGHLGTDVEGVMPPAPGLQGGAGHLKLLGRLTLGDALSLQPGRVLKEIGLFEPVPELVTVEIVAGGGTDYSAHSYFPLKPLPSDEK